ncbi:MAG: hypothetical protein J5758_05265, partial [Abditibacteriota bacterium]|nr:hypothetical protein [Abditibacteriota bacterium]
MRRYFLITAAAYLAVLAVFPFRTPGGAASSGAHAAPLLFGAAPEAGEPREVVTGIRIFNPLIKQDFFNPYYEDALGNSLKKGDLPLMPREHIPDLRIYDTSGVAFPGLIAYIHTIKPEPKVWDISVPDEIHGVNMFIFRYLKDPGAFAESYETLIEENLGGGYVLKEFDIFEDAKDCEWSSVPVDPERYRALRVLEHNGKTIWASVGSRPLDVQKSGKRYIVL